MTSTLIKSYSEDSNEPFNYQCGHGATHPTCEQHGGMPCEPCIELETIEAQIKGLFERRRGARLRRNNIHSPLIHQFPLEIVADIFTLAFPPRYKSPCCNVEKRASPLILTSVCHTWRILALSIPRLWCDITFNFNNPNLQLLDHQVAHSGELPLSIYLCAGFGSREDGIKSDMSVVLKQLYRTASLFVDLQENHMRAFADTDYPKVAPLLNQLHVHSQCRYDPCQLKLAIEPPRPRRVLFDFGISYDRIFLDWTRITNLTLKNALVHGLLPNLAASKRLRSLDLSLASREQFQAQTPIVIRSIRFLNLRTFDSVKFMITRTSLPLLRQLNILSVEELHVSGPLICDFLRRSKCQLHFLIIQWKVHRSITGEDGESPIQPLLNLLEHTNTLKGLALRFGRIFASSTFELLVQRLLSDGGFLPYLRTLTVSIRFVPPIDFGFLDVMGLATHVHSSEYSNGSNTVRPLRTLILELWMRIDDVGKISRDVVLRILQLRAAGKAVSIMCSPTGEFSEPGTDLVEYWQDSYGLGEY